MTRKRRKGHRSPVKQDHASAEGNQRKKKKPQSDATSESTQMTATNISEIGEFGLVAEETNATASGAVKEKLPPLVVKSVPLNKLFGDFTSLGVKAEFKLTGIGTKVILYTKAEFDLAKAFLKDSKVEFFTHDIPGEKPFKAVIRGLPNFDPKLIETS